MYGWLDFQFFSIDLIINLKKDISRHGKSICAFDSVCLNRRMTMVDGAPLSQLLYRQAQSNQELFNRLGIQNYPPPPFKEEEDKKANSLLFKSKQISI